MILPEPTNGGVVGLSGELARSLSRDELKYFCRW